MIEDETNAVSGACDDSYALALHVLAVGSSGAGSHRANQVHGYGVNSDFFEFSPAPTNIAIAADGVLLNQELATQLGVKPGDSVLLRLNKPSAFSSDAPLSPKAA